MQPSTSRTNEELPDIEVQFEKHPLPEKCQVCGKKAVGFHYNVPSCNGCKAFFRRVIITGRIVKCTEQRRCFAGDKPLELAKGRLCGKCRFEKCRAVGMNAKLIRPEIISEEGKELVQKIERLETRLHEENSLSEMISKLSALESKAIKLHNGNYEKDFADLRSFSEILKSPANFETLKTDELSELENQTFPNISGMVHNSFLSVVQYTKSLDFFPRISIESNEKLIKRSTSLCRNMMLSFYSLKRFRSDIVRRQDGSLSGNPLMSYNGLWIDHRGIIQKTLHAMARNRVDDVEFTLLKAIIMCNPGVLKDNDRDKSIVEREQKRYAKCLMDYCLLQVGRRGGPERFAALMSMVSVMENQQLNEKSFHVVLRAFHKESKWLVSPLYDDIMEH